jgi:hypothetical protein
MPLFTYLSFPDGAADIVSPMAHFFKTIADEHNLRFHVTPKEEEETEPVVVAEGVSVPTAVQGQLRDAAERHGVTIHVIEPLP